MSFLKKILKIVSLTVLLIIVLAIIWWFWPERTPQISSKYKNSIATIDYIKIGDVEQCVLIRSNDINNPIMLFLHGGPGMPMMYLAHEFQRPLEKYYTVVQWDRRGSGKTYSRNKPAKESMTIRQLIDDTYDLIDTLNRRYNNQKIILVGHSFGTYLGSILVNERPDLFKAFISIGQEVDAEKAKIYQEIFIRRQAEARGNHEIIEQLDNSENLNFENWLFEFGGELKNSTSFFPLIWSGLQAPEYTLPEALDLAEASSFSSTKMKYNVISNSIYYDIRQYDMPVYFLAGRSDYTTPHELIKDYYELIQAPKKDLIYFEDSAHFPFYEEPEKFCQEIIRVLSD